jgi:dual specificity tyrosine-phosphorylation-regulated kinase 2/3/4
MKPGVVPSTTRRVSGMCATSTLSSGGGVKRTSTGANAAAVGQQQPQQQQVFGGVPASLSNSSLPRASIRSVSGSLATGGVVAKGQDLAAAGATVAMSRRV